MYAVKLILLAFAMLFASRASAGSCTWSCQPCDHCAPSPLDPGKCIYYGGVGRGATCRMTEDCLFGNLVVRKGTDLNNRTAMGDFTMAPYTVMCVPEPKTCSGTQEVMCVPDPVAEDVSVAAQCDCPKPHVRSRRSLV